MRKKDILGNFIRKNPDMVYTHAYRIYEQIKNSKWGDSDFLSKLSDKLLLDYMTGDIPGYEKFIKTEPLNKGWSSDRKYIIKTAEGEKLLLRIADIAEYDRKKAEYNMAVLVLCPRKNLNLVQPSTR